MSPADCEAQQQAESVREESLTVGGRHRGLREEAGLCRVPERSQGLKDSMRSPRLAAGGLQRRHPPALRAGAENARTLEVELPLQARPPAGAVSGHGPVAQVVQRELLAREHGPEGAQEAIAACTSRHRLKALGLARVT